MKRRKKGVITFEWILLFSLLLIGIIGGIAIIRDALIIESTEVADAILHNNKSYIVAPPLEIRVSYNGRGDSIPYAQASFSGSSHYIEPFIPGKSPLVFLEPKEETTGE